MTPRPDHPPPSALRNLLSHEASGGVIGVVLGSLLSVVGGWAVLRFSASTVPVKK